MNWLIEKLLGLDGGFLSREGDFSLAFNPQWPLADSIGAAFWNLLLIAAGVALVVYVYRREGRSRGVRIGLAAVRLALLALALVLLNRPVLTLTQSRIEPSVLAVMVDDSLSMRVKDIGDAANPQGRLEAVARLLEGEDRKLLKDLAAKHQVKLYRFDADAASLAGDEAIGRIEAIGQRTQLTASLRSVLRDSQGQRLAGVVVLSDGRDMPQQSIASALDEVKDFGVPVFPVPVGSDRALRNVEVQQVSVQDAVFVNDVANIKATLRVKGETAGPIVVRLKDKNGQGMRGPDGKPVEAHFAPVDDQPAEVELQIAPTVTGVLDLVVEADNLPGEIDTEDNSRAVQLSVLDAKINVVYVEGFPRWDYRYLKNEMIRDRTVNISCLLTSADPTFRQEGDIPITRFPETLDELLTYDVVLMGDVDPRQFTDRQLQLIADFVSRRGGGVGMVAGPLFSPAAWKGTPIEPILPVDISRAQPDEWGTSGATIAEGFRPVLTRDGRESSLFRFFADREENDKYLQESWQPVFWFARNVVAKPGVGEVMAEHPTESGPDGRRAPILVTGNFGAGRTAFLGIDDSWRWRYYTGESIFNTYWVQQLRFLARSRKLGQRKITMASQKPVYDLGQQVRLTLRVIDPQLSTQLPETLRVELYGTSTGDDEQLVGQQTFVRQEGGDTYLASFPADRIGKLTARLPSVAPGVEPLSVPIAVAVPRLELSTPEVDRAALSRLASETGGRVIELADAGRQLPAIPSAERLVPLLTNRPLWDAPIALAAFILLLTCEWVARKWFGMV